MLRRFDSQSLSSTELQRFQEISQKLLPEMFFAASVEGRVSTSSSVVVKKTKPKSRVWGLGFVTVFAEVGEGVSKNVLRGLKCSPRKAVIRQRFSLILAPTLSPVSKDIAFGLFSIQ